MLLPFSGPHHWAGSTWSRPAAAGHSGRTAESAVPGPDPELDPADLQRRDDSTGRQRRAELRHFPGFGELLGAADADRDHLFSLHVSVTSSPEKLKERERLNHQQRQNNKNFFQKKETKLIKKDKKIFFCFFSILSAFGQRYLTGSFVATSQKVEKFALTTCSYLFEAVAEMKPSSVSLIAFLCEVVWKLNMNERSVFSFKPLFKRCFFVKCKASQPNQTCPPFLELFFAS